MSGKIENNSRSHIYDKMFKKVLTLSSKAVINFINGLFETEYSTDAKVTYNWTEFHDDNLKKILADTIVTIDGCHSYHIEAQRYQDETIVFRVFEYGYRHAERYKEFNDKKSYLHFPEPKIIYLYAEGDIPETYTLVLDFGTQGSFEYQVSTIQLESISVDELNQKKMIILIPFYLLSLHKIIKRKRSKETLEQLKRLIFNDILGSIEMNHEYGNITMDDADRLRNLTKELYYYLYSHYEEMEEINDMTDESLILEYDIFLKKHNIESLDETVQWIEEERKYIADSKAEIEANKAEIEANKAEIEANKAEIEAEKAEMEMKKAEIETERGKVKEERDKVQKEHMKMIKSMVDTMKTLNITEEEIQHRLMEICHLSKEEASQYIKISEV
ncbi:MAG: hypothetical protein UHN47_06570 [Lachnospiraceae bacterium]|nr:hypothetical protein [Lachnospiraceae bacterium]